MESTYSTSPISFWDIYSALRLQGKPVELLYMRSGEHVLTQPAERYASQEMNVDWYDFWLNAHEDANPSKAEQYAPLAPTTKALRIESLDNVPSQSPWRLALKLYLSSVKVARRVVPWRWAIHEVGIRGF